jgi:sugar lactone lactonase YvrE
MRTLFLTGVAVALAWPQLFAQQSPPQPPPCRDTPDVQFVCGVQAPEDLVVLPGGQWVVASAYAGSGGIYLVRVSDRTSAVAYPSAAARERFDAKTYNTCPGPPDAATKASFRTHGLYLQSARNSVHKLLAVLHGGRESVEVFELDARPPTPVLTWIGCAVAPEPIGLNSVRALPDGGFVATDFLARGITPEARAKMLAGEKNGALWEWHTATGWQKVPGSEAAGANGIELSEDGKWYYVAAWGSQSFFRLSRLRQGSGEVSPKRDEIPLGFRVDNIRRARDGSILATGQTGMGSEAATVVAKIDPKALSVKEILRRPNTDAFGAGTIAVEIGKTLWIGSFRGDRIAIVPAP